MTEYPHSRSSFSECQAVLELIPSYALGATDPEETRFVEQHLHDCPEAAAELQLFSRLNDDLLFEAPLTTAPAELYNRVMQIPRQHLQPVRKPEPSPAVSPVRGTSRWFLSGLAAAAVVALVLTNIYWSARITELQRNVETTRTDLARQEQILALVLATDARQTQLVSMAASPAAQGSGRIWWQTDGQPAVMQVTGLAALTADQTYQLWLLTDSTPASAGIFKVDDQGTGTLVFEVPVQEFNGFGITLEPAGGSPQPTTNPLLIGEI